MCLGGCRRPSTHNNWPSHLPLLALQSSRLSDLRVWSHGSLFTSPPQRSSIPIMLSELLSVSFKSTYVIVHSLFMPFSALNMSRDDKRIYTLTKNNINEKCGTYKVARTKMVNRPKNEPLKDTQLSSEKL